MKRFLSIALSASIVVASVGCYSDPDTNTQIGAAAGGLIGAGLGAVVGAQTGSPGAGVAIGSVAGALAGGAVGNKIDAQEKRYVSNEERLARQERELGSTRRQIEGLRRSQDSSVGDTLARARPARIVAKEDMSRSTRARLAQMAAEGKVVDPFAGRSGGARMAGVGFGEEMGAQVEGDRQGRAGLKLQTRDKPLAARRLGEASKDNAALLGVQRAKAAKLGEGSKAVAKVTVEDSESTGRLVEEMVEEIPEAGGDNDSLGVVKLQKGREPEGGNGNIRPSSIFSPLSPTGSRKLDEKERLEGAVRHVDKREGNHLERDPDGQDSFSWGGQQAEIPGRMKVENDDFTVSDVGSKKRGEAGQLGGGTGSSPALPGVSEETLGELLDKDQLGAKADSKDTGIDDAAIAENARKIENITLKGAAETGLEEINLVKGRLDASNGEPGAAKLEKARVEAASELARYGEESTLGDLSELEGEIDSLTKDDQGLNGLENQAMNQVEEQSGLKLNENISPCAQAAADLKEGMAIKDQGFRLFHYRRAIRLCPSDPQYHNALGEFYFSLKRYDDARHEFREALMVDPSYSRSLKNMKDLDRLESKGN